jgi:tetratricopeptide (TPR) repeat protein
VFGENLQKSDWIGLLNEATAAGILEDLGGNIYKIHPALPWYLRQQLDKMGSQEVISNLEKKLLVFYAALANNYREKLISNAELASFVLRVEEPNLLQQLRLAEQQQDWAYAQAILQALGDVYERWVRKPEFKSLRQRALNQIGLHLALAKAKGKDAFDFWMYLRGVDANEAIESADLETARVVYQEILDELTALNDPSVNDKIAGVYHQLGIVAQEQRWFDEAIAFYHKSLQIYEDAGDFYSAASDYHHLGMVAQEQRRFDDAIAFYHKSLPIYEDAKDFYSAAREYHQLGIVAQEQRRFDDAIAFYHKSLQICEDVGDFYNAAKQYHNLGYIAQEQQRFDEAIAFYHKALQILEDVGDFYKVASVYHNLGALAHKQQRFDDAIAFYNKALKIREDAGDFRSAANQYQGLGNIAKEQGDFDTAVAYFQKAFTATSAVNDWRKASSTLTAWGRTLEIQSNWTEAVKIYIQALAIDIKHNSEFVRSDTNNLGRMLKQLGDSQFQEIWRELTGEECPGEVFSIIQKASETEEEGAD